jgi:cytosine/adenosine deaminase-related metal-dependent hydrolase
VSTPLWTRLAGEAAWRAFPIHTHGSETREEVEEVRRLTGMTPPAFCAALRGGEGRVKLAHAIWIDDDDRRALAQCGAAVLHCPGSNLKLGSGLCDLQSLEREGIPLGIGPDGAACNNRLDPWQEMRLAAYARSLLHGPESVDPAAVLRQATLGGAEALGLGEVTGSLRRGKRADLVILDPGREPAMLGLENADESPEAALVHSGSPVLVRETIVDGRSVFRSDDPDLGTRRRDLAARARAARRALLERARLHPPQES